jgi:hypothetical protein
MYRRFRAAIASSSVCSYHRAISRTNSSSSMIDVATRVTHRTGGRTSESPFELSSMAPANVSPP